MKNIIRKQTVRFQYNGKSDGFALQKEVSDWCTLTLIPQIEQQLEPFCLLDEYISLDKVEINTETGDADWKQKIQQEILFSLRKNLGRSTNVIDTKLTGKQEVGSFNTQTHKSSGGQADKKDTIASKSDELFIYFFSKGYLPWWSNAVLTKDFKLTLQDWIRENKENVRADSIRKQLQLTLSEAVVTRILNLLPGQLFFQFLKNIFKKDLEIIEQLDVFLKETIPSKISVAKKEIIVQPVYGFILTELLGQKEEINLKLLVKLLYTELQKQKIANRSGGLKSASKTKLSGSIEVLWQQLLVQSQKMITNKITDSVKKQKDEINGRENYNKVIDQIKNQPDKIRKRPDVAEDLLEGIFIDNSGAVIVAAFLPRLFEKLKIVKDNSIVNKDMAVLIIQYSVAGKTKIDEFELVLPKILCGIELDEPINTSKKITAAQRKEADEMLSSVIEHWAALKNTSVQGLREAFLQRSGKLILTDNEWVLQVERKSYDMLLQQLPWSFTMLKLPWMKNLLKTDWV